MQTRPRLKSKHMFGAGVPTRQVDLSDIGRGAHVEGFDLILAEHARLVEMIDLLPLDLAEEIDLGVEMERRSRLWRADEDRRFQAHYFVGEVIAPQMPPHLGEQRIHQIPKAVMMAFEPLQE